ERGWLQADQVGGAHPTPRASDSWSKREDCIANSGQIGGELLCRAGGFDGVDALRRDEEGNEVRVFRGAVAGPRVEELAGKAGAGGDVLAGVEAVAVEVDLVMLDSLAPEFEAGVLATGVFARGHGENVAAGGDGFEVVAGRIAERDIVL